MNTRNTVMTNRQAHEEAAGMNLTDDFFSFNGIDPDAPYIEPKSPRKRISITCHTCDKRTTRYEDDVIEQLVTGRRFCSVECWNKHLDTEGFSV